MAELTTAAVVAQPTTVALPLGSEIFLETTVALSSKTSAKGDLVPMQTVGDIRINGVLLIPKGAIAVGQVIDVQTKGGMGMSGKLVMRPLYLRAGDTTVRLTGRADQEGSVTGGAIVGMIFLTPGFTGRSAAIPSGTKVVAMVERSVNLPGLPN